MYLIWLKIDRALDSWIIIDTFYNYEFAKNKIKKLQENDIYNDEYMLTKMF